MAIATVIVAAGRGTRFVGTENSAQPAKQYWLLHGKPVLAHSLDIFAHHPQIDMIQPVIAKGDDSHYDKTRSQLQLPDALAKKIMPAVYGGATRQQSVWHGLQALSPPPDYVLIHDAARPFITPQQIDSILTTLKRRGVRAVLPVIAVNDTIKLVSNGRVDKTLPRHQLKRAQTPQGFDCAAIRAAHQADAEQGCRDASDDAAVAERHGITVTTIEGDKNNIKMTHKHDLQTATAVSFPDIRVGSGFDVHQLVDGKGMILGGIHIPFHKSLTGHSDADVVLHALTDAILGALSDNDIGYHFPPSDKAWHRADSAQFLAFAAQRAKDRGYRISHCDMTILCEQPKITPHRAALCANIAKILAIDVACISVKATTTEKLGFCGRGEGIATQATATLIRLKMP